MAKEDKVWAKALEKKLIKEWAYTIHDKDPRLQLRAEASLHSVLATPPWNVGDPSLRSKVIKVSPAQTVETT